MYSGFLPNFVIYEVTQTDEITVAVAAVHRQHWRHGQNMVGG